MTSIFDLQSSVAELKDGNDGIASQKYEQISAMRDPTNFSNGDIRFKFSVSNNKWWVPNRSFMRMRSTLTDSAAAQLTMAGDVAPNMNFQACLYQRAELRINGTTVCDCDAPAQVDTLAKRMDRSAAWTSGTGSDTALLQPSWYDRAAVVSADGTTPSSVETTTVDSAALGFDATNTMAWTSATSLLTFAAGGGAAPPDVRLVYPAGSQIRITNVAAGLANQLFRVVEAPTALTLVLDVGKASPANVGAIVFTGEKVVQGKAARAVSSFETCWTPDCLPIFKIGHALPAGEYELILTPHADFAQRAVESITGAAVSGTDFTLAFSDLYLQLCTVEGPRVDDASYMIDMDNIRMLPVDLTGGAAAVQVKKFDVSPSCHALSVAFQDNRSSSLYSPSKFKLNGSAADELDITRMYVEYAGQHRPAPDADPQFSATADYTVQRYTQSMIENGQYFSSGSAETLKDWHDRGAYYHFAYPRDGGDRSTQATISSTFSTDQSALNRLLVFDHHRRVARVEIQQGRVIRVEVMDL